MELTREAWRQEDYDEFYAYLQSLAEEKYKKFSQSLTPDTPNMLGIRVPILRRTAKEILKGSYKDFLKLKRGTSHEEGIIAGLVMAGSKADYPEILEMMKLYSEVIYNWAMCDTVSFKGIKKHRAEFFCDVDWFLESGNPWAVRSGLLHLMGFYLDKAYIDAVLEKTVRIKSDFYYVQMMQAWLLATAFAKCRKETLNILEQGEISENVMKMTVRKIRDSYRVSAEDKDLVRKFLK